MARKNYPIIYDQVYRPAIHQYEQLRLAGRGDPPPTIILNECGLNSIITDNGTGLTCHEVWGFDCPTTCM